MDTRTFQELHIECRERVLFGIRGYVRNHDEAEDVTASAFATAFQKRKSFRQESSFYTWVYRIAVNRATSVMRRKRTVSLDLLEGALPESLIEADLMDRAIDRDDCCRKLRWALRQIPVLYRRVLVDHFVRGFSTKQIAKRNRIPVGTVLSRIFSAKRRLRRAWELRHGPENGD
jgi:RNA polymerase sigma-70 factor (ECF subfamily)